MGGDVIQSDGHLDPKVYELAMGDLLLQQRTVPAAFATERGH